MLIYHILPLHSRGIDIKIIWIFLMMQLPTDPCFLNVKHQLPQQVKNIFV